MCLSWERHMFFFNGGHLLHIHSLEPLYGHCLGCYHHFWHFYTIIVAPANCKDRWFSDLPQYTIYIHIYYFTFFSLYLLFFLIQKSRQTPSLSGKTCHRSRRGWHLVPETSRWWMGGGRGYPVPVLLHWIQLDPQKTHLWRVEVTIVFGF